MENQKQLIFKKRPAWMLFVVVGALAFITIAVVMIDGRPTATQVGKSGKPEIELSPQAVPATRNHATTAGAGGRADVPPGISTSPAVRAVPLSGEERLRIATKKQLLPTATRQILEGALSKGASRGGAGDRGMISRNDFQIDYLASEERFIITIRDTKNPQKAQRDAERYFLDTILGTQNRQAACELDVVVVQESKDPSPLSFCPARSASLSVSSLNDIISSFLRWQVPWASASPDWCSEYPAGLVTNWCTAEKIQPYFGDIADKAARIAYRESDHCIPTLQNYSGGPYYGLFQIGSLHCATYFPDMNTTACINDKLYDPEQNMLIARHIFDNAGGIFADASCNPWQAACACSLVGDVGKPNIAAPTVVPSPKPPGDIVVTPAIRSEQLPTLEIWLEGQTPKQASGVNATVFSGLAPGPYQVHLRASGPGVDSNYSITTSVYTVCDSVQDGCKRSQCNPLHGSCPLAFTEDAYGKYHVWDAQRGIRAIPNHEVAVDVNVPAGGFVDLMIYVCPSDLAGTGGCVPTITRDDVSQTLAKGNLDFRSAVVKEARAATRSPLPPPSPSVLLKQVANLPSCSDTTYGGSTFDTSKNARTQFFAYNATKVEFEAYTNGTRFYNSLQDEGGWQNLNTYSAYDLSVYFYNLSPDAVYSWRVRAGNETQWSPWQWGYPWKVSPCTLSPPPVSSPPPIYNFWEGEQWCNSGDAFTPDVRFHWGTVSDATEYAVYIWDPGSVIPIPSGGTRNDGWVVGPRRAFSTDQQGSMEWWDLPNDTQQTWSVETYNSWGSSGVSQWKDFRTKDCIPIQKPSNLQVWNTITCSDNWGWYGGTDTNNGNPPNIKFTWYSAPGTTAMEQRWYENNDLKETTTYWGSFWKWNLLKASSYQWSVRIYNHGGWSEWVDGPSLPPIGWCNPPPTVTSMTANPPVCRDNPFTMNFSWTLSGTVTGVEFRLANSWEGYSVPKSWASSQTSTQVTNIPAYRWSYEWQVRAQNNGNWGNWAYKTFYVPACDLPDLIVDSLTTNKSEYGIGESVNVTVVIKNVSTKVGVASGGNFKTYLGWENLGQDATGWTTCGRTSPVEFTVFSQPASSATPFAAGATATYSFPIPANRLPQTAGSYTIRAIVDGLCLVTEHGETQGSVPFQANNIRDTEIKIADMDSDGDGFTNAAELYMGTDPFKACADTSTANDEALPDAWPVDFNDDQKASLADVVFAFVTTLAPYGGLNISVNLDPSVLRRVDLNGDGFIDLQDVVYGYVTKLAPEGLNKTCTP